MRKPRIALFTGNYNHIRDGVSHTLNRLVAHLEKRQVPVRVFGPWTPEPAMEHAGEFVPVYAIPAPGRSEYRIALGFPETEKQKLRDFQPDIIHIATPDILGLMALRYAIKNRIPAVASYHTHFSSYLKYYRLGFLTPLVQKYLHWFYGKCEHLYVPSPSMMEVLKNEGIQVDMRLWTRGVDTSLFQPDMRDASWRRKAGFSEDHFVVTFVSRLVWEKNLEMVADTFRRIMKLNTSIRTLIVGDGPAKEELSRMLPDTVFSGHLEGRELAKAYAGSDLFFFPSDTESFGNVTLEAMSCGLPAVVAEAIGSCSLVENRVNGYRARATDHDAFCRKILEIAGDSKLHKKMASAAREKAKAYEWDRVMDQLLSFYHEIFSDKTGNKTYRTTIH